MLEKWIWKNLASRIPSLRWLIDSRRTNTSGGRFPHFLFMPRFRSASVDFWFSAFKESELREEENTFYEKLGAFLINQPKYIQVGDLLLIQLDAPSFSHSIFIRTCNLMFH